MRHRTKVTRPSVVTGASIWTWRSAGMSEQISIVRSASTPGRSIKYGGLRRRLSPWAARERRGPGVRRWTILGALGLVALGSIVPLGTGPAFAGLPGTY